MICCVHIDYTDLLIYELIEMENWFALILTNIHKIYYYENGLLCPYMPHN